LDVANGRISATAPHLSTYGVGASPPAELPVTGAPLAPGALLGLLLVIGVPGAIVVLRRKRPDGRRGR
jgi:LPXTG-motif cell wall-anchored protein